MNVLFLLPRMDDHDVRVAAPGDRQRLAGPDGNHVHAASVLALEIRQDGCGQAGVDDAHGRGQTQHGLVRRAGQRYRLDNGQSQAKHAQGEPLPQT